MRILVIVIVFFGLGILLGNLPKGESKAPALAQDADFVGKKIPLETWPSDSVLHSLDSIPPQEWINEASGPAFDDSANQISKVIEDPAKPSQGSATSATALSSSAHSLAITDRMRPIASEGSAAWLPAFASTLKAMEEGEQPGQKITVLAGEQKLEQVLLRVYGPKSKQIPRSLIDYSLRAINKDLDLNALKAGQTLKLPKI